MAKSGKMNKNKKQACMPCQKEVKMILWWLGAMLIVAWAKVEKINSKGGK